MYKNQLSEKRDNRMNHGHNKAAEALRISKKVFRKQPVWFNDLTKCREIYKCISRKRGYNPKRRYKC
jgi:hypothetical protein